MAKVSAVPRWLFHSLLLSLSLTACTSWQPATVAPAQLLSDKHPESVRVTRTDACGSTSPASPEIPWSASVSPTRNTSGWRSRISGKLRCRSPITWEARRSCWD